MRTTIHNPFLHAVEHGVERHNRRLGNTFDQIVLKIERGVANQITEYTSPSKAFYGQTKTRMVLTWHLHQRTDYAFRPTVYLAFNLRRGGTDDIHRIRRVLPDTGDSLKKFRKELPKLFWKHYAGILQ